MIPIVKVAMPAKSALMPALEEVLYSGMIAEGESVYRFESEFNKKFGLKHSLAMSSGTGALHAALTLAGVGPGDEVISTPMTAEPTNTSILYNGAKVVWADVDPASGNMCPESVRNCITSRTKAILCVHYAGYPVRLAELKRLADEHGIALIEDCAHALGARYQDRPIGTIGHYGIYSFQAIKHMTTVDGGLLTLSDESQLDAAKKFRWFGMLKGVPRTEIDITSVGYKYNMNNVNATIGLVQLQNISAVLDRHIENGKFYDAQLESVSGVDFARCDAVAEPSYWIYTLLCDDSASVEKALNAAGIAASKLHRPNSLHSIFAASRRELPGLEAFYKRLLHIPCGWWVSDEDRERIVDAIRKG
ncbi:DegT/DnrJ/EryC1/StrS family aminotransferase [Cupriavidus sp. IDO]|uniref:DegT/DnrJ/EryC1/StrS family aminotransferase n=1 Tax=Cupriavidus sp. IDO TaxID=1539142 RepID=UPI0005793C14|nr:DegT/DnrJ/EryC1/StrS family aminotransferase [Cupriavidus sp. IDO]KWR90161.1 pyridoxal-5'-phosphate-dependent protein [Cupriavidus sp. IDO]